MTYIIDDFSGAVYEAWWDSDFSAWPLEEYPPASGNYSAVAGSDDTVELTPTGVEISGDFSLETTFQMGATDMPPAANESLHFFLHKVSDDSLLCEVSWWSGAVRWIWDALSKDTQADVWAAYKEIRVKMVRVGTTITAYWWNGASWEAQANPLTYGDPIYIMVNGATYNGFKEFNLEAEGGFPYSAGTSKAQLVGQLMHQLSGQL